MANLVTVQIITHAKMIAKLARKVLSKFHFQVPMANHMNPNPISTGARAEIGIAINLYRRSRGLAKQRLNISSRSEAGRCSVSGILNVSIRMISNVQRE
jgi:hypothetical protein